MKADDRGQLQELGGAINLTDQEWSAELHAMNPACRDVYFTPEYHRLHEANGDGESFAAIARSGSNTLLIPGLKSSVNTQGRNLWDLQTCNGYGGPVAAGDDFLKIRDRLWEDWKAAWRAAGMVAAFFRLHPLLGNEALLPSDAEIKVDRKTVFVDLKSGIEDHWRRAASQHRNKVSKARREGVTVRWNEPSDWAAFVELYDAAMRRLSAPERLHFSQGYFEKLQALPGAELAFVRQGAKAVAGSVFLFGEVWGHYHLSARSADAPNYVANCILESAFEGAADRGVQVYILEAGEHQPRMTHFSNSRQRWAGGWSTSKSLWWLLTGANSITCVSDGRSGTGRGLNGSWDIVSRGLLTPLPEYRGEQRLVHVCDITTVKHGWRSILAAPYLSSCRSPLKRGRFDSHGK